MSNLNRHPVRRAAVGVLAGTLAFTGGAIAAGISPANAVEGFAFERLAGTDRYGTAADIATDSFPDGATTAIIARGDDFADALAANYLAGVLDAPILLTATNALPATTASALEALGVEDVVIVGGFSAVSSGVQATLAADYGVSRLGGNDRYLTAELIAGAASEESAGAVGELGGLRTAILASGQVFADALAAGPIAYAGNHPILITRPGDLPASTADVLADLDIEQVVIVGQTAAVSADVEEDAEAAVGAAAIRVGGQTRYETAAMIAEQAYAAFGFDETHVNLARGDDFADALAGGPHGGRDMAPIVLTASDALSPATEAFLEENCPTLEDGHIFGGPVAVSNAVETAAEAAAANCAVDGDITLTATTVVAGADLTGSVTGDNVDSVTVTGAGLTDEDVTVDAEGNFTLTIPAGTAAGAVELVFTVTLDDGTERTETITVTVTAPATNQTFSVTPATAETLRLADELAATAAVRNADNRSFSVSGLTNGTTYRITLVNNDSIRTDANGAVSFLSATDAASRTGFSASTGVDNADIVAVNNAAPAFAEGDTEAARTVTVQPVNGSITFEIDGTDTGSVTPVVYINGGPDSTDAQGGTSIRLEVAATAVDQYAAPTESFGVGGQTSFAAALATAGAITGPVTAVDKANNAFETGTGVDAQRYTFDSNDTYTVGGASVGATAFAAALSSGDGISGTFVVDPGGVSSFTLVDSNPAVPAAPTAARGTGADSRNVTVTTDTLDGDADQVVVQRANVAGSTVGTFVTIATVAATDAVTTTDGVQVRYVDANRPNGTYQYRVAVINDGDQSDAGAASADVTITDTDTTAPTVTDLRVGANAGNPFTLETADTFKLVASEVLAAPGAGDAFRVTDTDGTILDLVNETAGVTFVLNTGVETVGGVEYAIGRVLTVTVGTGTPAAAGTAVGLNVPATITSQAGNTDVASNPLSLTGDVVIDNE